MCERYLVSLYLCMHMTCTDCHVTAQYTLKLAASDLFRGKKETYPASVARPYLNTHLCE